MCLCLFPHTNFKSPSILTTSWIASLDHVGLVSGLIVVGVWVSLTQLKYFWCHPFRLSFVLLKVPLEPTRTSLQHSWAWSALTQRFKIHKSSRNLTLRRRIHATSPFLIDCDWANDTFIKRDVLWFQCVFSFRIFTIIPVILITMIFWMNLTMLKDKRNKGNVI